MTDIDTAAPSEVLKRDARGRVHTTRARREALLDEFERSGLSGPAFARVDGLCYQTGNRHAKISKFQGDAGDGNALRAGR